MILRIFRYAATTATLLIMAGCVPHISVIHDGVRATVIDAVSKQPVEGARVVDGGRRDDNGVVRYWDQDVLASSDAHGQIQLAPATHLVFDVLLGEAWREQTLWICKDGYAPVLAGGRGGWNSDLSPSETIDMGTVDLVRSDNPARDNCTHVATP